MIVRAIWITLGLGLVFLYGFVNLTRCIVEATLVDTPTGARPIEELEAGDVVWSKAPDGTLARSTVVSVYESRTFHHLRFTFAGGRQLEVTATHPLATEAGWTQAEDVAMGQEVTGRFGNLDTTDVETVVAWRAVYDLTVEPHSNFFANGVLVHNKRIYAPDVQAIGDTRSVISALQTYAAVNCGFFPGDITDATRGDGTPIGIPEYPDEAPEFLGTDLARPSPYVKSGYHRSYQAFGQPAEIPPKCSPNSALRFCYTSRPNENLRSDWPDGIPDWLVELLPGRGFRSFVGTTEGAIYMDLRGRDLACVDGEPPSFAVLLE